ncbi:MAG: hypothetical protein HQL48_03740, partial [Gammaproteobacteria bacterium]|nr:hypothetical protein [Gammaproteobacteria bacterium]
MRAVVEMGRRRGLFVALFWIGLLFNPLFAANINLSLSQRSVDDQITVEIHNSSPQAVSFTAVEVVLDGRVYRHSTPFQLSPQSRHALLFTVEIPELPGSYVQQTVVHYLNDGVGLTLQDVGYFHYRGQRVLPERAQLVAGPIYGEGRVNLTAAEPDQWRLLLPQELAVGDEKSEGGEKSLLLRNLAPGFNNNYPVFMVKEVVREGIHYAVIIPERLAIRAPASSNYERGRLSTNQLLTVLLVAVALFLLLFFRLPQQAHWGHYLSRLIWVTTGYLLLKNGGAFFDLLLRLSSSSPLAVADPLWLMLRDHLLGKEYRYFFLYFIDGYWAAVLLLYPLYHHRYGSRDRLEDDKYGAALLTLLLPLRRRAERTSLPEGTLLPPAKLGFLILAVKLFFLPLLASWVINNVIHQWHLTQTLSWDFKTINAYLLAMLILTDTAIFLVGYSVESRTMGSKVRSVEPTLLGWVVCLWCYPPFNQFSFAPFDVELIPIHVTLGPWGEGIALIAVTLCWGIFVWASLALGFKASNLTNRGIVTTGPYRYCRHPAYTAKVVAWM